MAYAPTNIPIGDIAKNLTLNITVTGVDIFTARLKIACQIMRLAAAVAGVGIKIEPEVKKT